MSAPRRWFAKRLESIRHHWLALLLVLLAAVIGQAATLIQQPLAWFTNDTPSYLAVAQHLTQSASGLIDATRTPGYPVFIALVLTLVFQGSVPYDALMACRDAGQLGTCVTDLQYIVYAQAVVAVITLLEVYILVFRITHRQVAACVVAMLLAVNLYFGGFERLAMTEFLSYWALVTTLLLFERFAHRPTVPMGISFGLVSFLAIMIRPVNLYISILLLGFLLLRHLYIRELGKHWKSLLASALVVASCVLGYMSLNQQVNKEFGLTWVININLFGKVLEYRMTDLPVDQKYAALQANTIAFAQSDHPGQNTQDPFAYASIYALSDSHFTQEAAFSRALILHHPVTFVKKSVPEIIRVWLAPATFYSAMGLPNEGQQPVSDSGAYVIPGYSVYPSSIGQNIPSRFEPGWINALLILSTLMQNAYLTLPLVVVALLFLVWRNPRSTSGFILLSMALMIVAAVCLSAMAGYADFYRYRFPADWAMIALVVIGLVEAIDALIARRVTRADAGDDIDAVGAIDTIDTAPVPAVMERDPRSGGILALSTASNATWSTPLATSTPWDQPWDQPRYDSPSRTTAEVSERADSHGNTFTQPEISIVLPCLNEEEAIGQCIDTLQQIIAARRLSAEIVVVDNASTDRSAEIARQHGARVVFQPIRGYGNAYLKGFAEARGRFIVMADADNTYDFNEVEAFVAPLRQGYDLVMGNRFTGRMAKGAMTWSHRYIGNPVLSGLLNAFFRTGIRDAHCGMRAFTKDAYYRMRLRTGGMEFASEMVINAAKAGLKITERPIAYHPRIGESKLHTIRDGWRHLRFMLLYSPTHLFLIPGLLLFILGFLIMAILLPAPLVLFGHNWDVHSMMLGSVISIIGLQIVLIGLFARFFSLTEDLDGQSDAVLQAINRWFNLERGLAIGGFIFLVGFGIDAYVLFKWIFVAHLGQLAEIRETVFATALIATGVQIFFASFFLSFLQFRKSIHSVDEQLPVREQELAAMRSMKR